LVDKLVGKPKAETPAAMPEPKLSTEEGAITAPTPPTPPTMQPQPSQKQQSKDALKQLGGQLLNDFLSNGGASPSAP
jgi:hypothetical protein